MPSLFGVQAVLWSTAGKKGGNWYWGVDEAADCFLVRWSRGNAESSWLGHAAEDATSDDKRTGKGDGVAAVLTPPSTNAPKEWKIAW